MRSPTPGEAGADSARADDVRQLEALRERDQRYRDVFENALDSMFLLEVTEDGRFRNLDVNPAFVRSTGLSRESLIERFIEDTVPREVAAAVVAKYRRCVEAGHAIEEEVQLELPSGTRWFHSTLVPARDADGRVHRIVGISRDITAARQAEADLRASEAKYRTIFDESFDGMFVTSVEGAVLDVNRKGLQILGYDTHDEMRHLHVGRDIYANPPDRERLTGMVNERGAVEFEVDLRCKSGESVATRVALIAVRDEAGVVRSYRGVFRDIREQKRAEAMISLLRFAMDKVSESVFLIDERDRFQYVNEHACRTLGYSREEMLAMQLGDLDPTFPRDHAPAFWQQLRAEGRLLHQGQHRARDGRLIPVEVSINYFEYGGVGYDLAFARDVSERNRLEEQLRHAQKLEAIGTLAGGVAHDFNNILTAITGYGALAAMELPTASPARGSIDAILASAERAAHLTHGLLAFSRRQIIHRRPVRLNEVVRSVERLLGRLIGEHILLAVDLEEPGAIIHADPGQIEQVLVNLATNARDAMPGGGRLTISTRTTPQLEPSRRTGARPDPRPRVLVTVADTGVGMDEATRDRVFEPFFTTKEVGKGTGLGLAIAYGIVQQHEGTITVTSAPDQGCTVSILLPTVADAPSGAPDAAAPPPRGSGETILVAEDNAPVLEVLRRFLGDHGYVVIVATDGQDAIEKLASFDGRLDMAILDVIMPRANGRDVARAARERAPKMPILFLSGYSADILRSASASDENTHFMAKPVDPRALLERVRKILDARMSPEAGRG